MVIFCIAIGIILYLVFAVALSNVVRHKYGGDYFWLVFLFGLVGAILWVMLDTRNATMSMLEQYYNNNKKD